MHKRIPVLFFSRGRGHGHAIPDMAIAGELPKNIDITFASYATGAETLTGGQWPVIDLGLPEENRYLATFIKARQLILESKPAIVIAHEEFAAIAAASIENIRSIFLSAWLPPKGTIAAESLAYADAIIILEQAGLFPNLVGLQIRPRFVGPFYRKLQYSRRDREQLRADLNISQETFLIIVAPGGWATEEKAPIANIVLPAFEQLPTNEKMLVWIAGRDHRDLGERAHNLPGIKIVQFEKIIEKYFAASDVVITKASRGSTMDAANVGVPSISISSNLNPIDDLLVPRIKTNTALIATATDDRVLLSYLSQLLAQPSIERLFEPINTGGSSQKVANIVLEEITRLTHQGSISTQASATRPA